MRTEEEIQAEAAPERPFSNHSEYEVWASEYCYECIHDNPSTTTFCPILSVALLGGWPAEWTRRTITWQSHDPTKPGGSYEVVDRCTEFEHRPDPGDDDPDIDPKPEPDPVCQGQLDLIDAYLDTAITELTRAPEVRSVR